MNKLQNITRIIYSPSSFAKESLFYLQEVGKSTTVSKHTNSRNNMSSFLFFTVLEGNGTLYYNDKYHSIKKGDSVFVDCRTHYSHSSNNWTISWVHFNGFNMSAIYQKYLERGGKNIIKNSSLNYNSIINDIISICSSNSYIKDIEINNKISSLLYYLMSETIYQNSKPETLKSNINQIKNYIDDNYLNAITLDQISKTFYINKFYLTRLFKTYFGKTIIGYIQELRINKSKELLRFSNYSIEQISKECGFLDSNYYSRLFKKIEGITPIQYKKMW